MIEDEARVPVDGVVIRGAWRPSGWPSWPAWPARTDGDHGFAVVDLAEVDRAAVIIHHGSMDDVLPAVQALARWIDASGYRAAGYAREVTMEWSPTPIGG